MAENMIASGKNRVRQLSKKGTALAHIRRGLVDMTCSYSLLKFLLSSPNSRGRDANELGSWIFIQNQINGGGINGGRQSSYIIPLKCHICGSVILDWLRKTNSYPKGGRLFRT